jgi:hypothetical protein
VTPGPNSEVTRWGEGLPPLEATPRGSSSEASGDVWAEAFQDSEGACR